MINDNWAQWFYELKALATSQFAEEMIEEGYLTYREYFNLGLSPQEAYSQDF